MNYIFISPAYPVTCTYFCDRLHELGVNVLGIGDVPYDTLNEQLKRSLTEYYYVSSLEDYDQVYRAVAFYIHKYGRIDWLESLNEYWLPADARLRTDFNIATGTRDSEIGDLVRKSGMKRVFIEAGIPTARQHIVSDLEAAKAFIEQVGYPVIANPDIGVGANGTVKINSESELISFYENVPSELYVMEQFLCGDICTYDAVIDSHCEPLFESMCTYPPVIDSVHNDENVHFYTTPDVPEKLRDLGRKAVKAFGADSRFVHFEFINLKQDCEGVGKAGDFAVMEVNMRPAGGFTPDMLNVGQSADVFQLWADMVAFDEARHVYDGPHSYCVYAGRRDSVPYTHSLDEIGARYAENLRKLTRMPDALAGTMGNQVCIACFDTLEEVDDFVEFAFSPQKQIPKVAPQK